MPTDSAMKKCVDCRHFRAAPYEAKRDGCFHPEHMKGKQKDAFLDEQQMPGDHEQINARGDCAQYEARVARPSLLRRILSLGA
jgi:hypothetical protein